MSTTMSVLEELATTYGAIDHEDIPADVRRAARHCILDWIGCAIAGQDEPLAEILRAELVDGAGPCRLVGRRETAALLDAALVNGAAGHALDFDDTNLTMSGHPTVPVLPAVLALADVLGSSGREIVTALVVGTEVEVRLNLVLGGGHYARGWHTTGTLGVVGAAAACSRLMGLSPERTAMASALAVTQAGGLKSSFGTMAKPLHAGRAAADGLLAARLAARGFTGNPAIIEAAQGMVTATLSDGSIARSLDDVAGRWFTTETHFKFHAACYGTHAAINSALQLVGAGLAAGEIGQVRVVVTPSLLDVCGIDRPVTGLQGKFSLRAATALTLLGESTADLTQYSDARMAAPDLLGMIDRITVVGDDAQPMPVTTVSVSTTDGATREASSDSSVRVHDRDQEWDALVAKFHTLVDPRIGAEAERIVGCVAGLDEAPALLAAAGA
jgi:2-methylcitrate dehydratase PrpD